MRNNPIRRWIDRVAVSTVLRLVTWSARMQESKRHYEINSELVAYSTNRDALALMQNNLVDDRGSPNVVLMTREDLLKLRSAIDDFLSA